MPRGQPRLSFRELTARSQEAAELHATGLSYRKIAAKMQVHRMTAWRWVHWHDDMMAAWGFIPHNRARRLPFRNGLGWDQERFDRLVAERQKMLALISSDESRQDAADATRNADRARRDEAKEWIEAGSPPDKTPAWLKEALRELFPVGRFRRLTFPPMFPFHYCNLGLRMRCPVLSDRFFNAVSSSSGS